MIILAEIDLAELLHENAKARMELGLPLGAMPGGPSLPLDLIDISIKAYPTRPAIPLPPAAGPLHLDLSSAIRQRYSARAFRPVPIPLGNLAQLLFHGNGIKEVLEAGGHRDYRRNVPSAGNLGSVDLYPLVLDVDGLERGVYHYHPVEHRLAQIAGAEALAALEGALLQPEFGAAGVVIALGSSLARVRAKYGIRGYRYACMDAGHVAQNLALVATALGLGACPGGGFDDDRLNQLLDLDGMNEAVLSLVAIGATSA
jgi:SagB-type dehydrogenase family enzyme